MFLGIGVCDKRAREEKIEERKQKDGLKEITISSMAADFCYSYSMYES